MRPLDNDVSRLLRAAAQCDEAAPEMPFGFDTRVVAMARSSPDRLPPIAGAVRRVALIAAVVAVAATAGAWWEANAAEDSADPYGNAYAIADSAIETGAFQ